MPLHYTTRYTCDHCFECKEYEGEDPFSEIVEDGWIVVTIGEEEKTYCCAECLKDDL